MESRNWREFVQGIVPTVFQGFYGERLVGVLALLADLISEGASEALKVPWLREPTSPDDALRFAAFDRNLERYPNESAAQHRARLLRAWQDWTAAGDESAILGQLGAAAFEGAVIYCQGEWWRPPDTDVLGNPWWSLCWIFFPRGTHPASSQGPVCGAAGLLCGGGAFCGPVGLGSIASVLVGIIQKWKPADWVVRDLIFEISGSTCGTGHTCGESALACGGECAVMGAS